MPLISHIHTHITYTLTNTSAHTYLHLCTHIYAHTFAHTLTYRHTFTHTHPFSPIIIKIKIIPVKANSTQFFKYIMLYQNLLLFYYFINWYKIGWLTQDQNHWLNHWILKHWRRFPPNLSIEIEQAIWIYIETPHFLLTDNDQNKSQSRIPKTQNGFPKLKSDYRKHIKRMESTQCGKESIQKKKQGKKHLEQIKTSMLQ